MNFNDVIKVVSQGVTNWEVQLIGLDQEVISTIRNNQNRSIKQIVGHMIDSASNNIHRIIHLQYQPSPFAFPCYASNGNNDRWIAVQNYQDEDWEIMVKLWKYSHLHYIHVTSQINQDKINNKWDSGSGLVSLKEMVEDFPRHFQLHLDEIQELIDQN